MSLSGKTYLVTGAASGIGQAVAARLGAEGAGLVLADRNAEGLDAGTPRVGDVADPALWADALPPLDGAVLAAGVTGAAPIAEMDFAEWRRVMAANCDGLFLSLQAALRAMRDGGSVVLLASASGLRPAPNIAAYAASKAAAIQLAKVAALEAAPRGIRVNALCPGGVETPMWHDADWFRTLEAEVGREAAYRQLAAAGTPLGRFATADEIAGQCLFLLSDAAATITGAVIASDGGYSAS